MAVSSVPPPSSRGGRGPVTRPVGDVDLPNVLRARSGDPHALALLWEKYWRSLFNHFVTKVGSADDAEDLASETMWAAFRQLGEFRGYTSGDRSPSGRNPSPGPTPVVSCTFRTYLYSIAHNLLTQWIRRKQTRGASGLSEIQALASDDDDTGSPLDRMPADPEADPLNHLLRREHLDDVCYALADVGIRSGEQFKAVLFHYICDLSHKDVASLLGTRKETINTRLQEARQTLRNHYRRCAAENTPPAHRPAAS